MVNVRLKKGKAVRKFTESKRGQRMVGLLLVPIAEKPMLEFAPNTIAIMTASLEQCCKKLKNDTPTARKFVADKLMEAARRGQVSLLAQTDVGEDAVAQLNRGDEAVGWRALFQWAI